jgi:hypothetical protein
VKHWASAQVEVSVLTWTLTVPLGRIHSRPVGSSLLAALTVALGDDFDAATRQAWELAYSLVAETMLEGAAATRPIDRERSSMADVSAPGAGRFHDHGTSSANITDEVP